MAAYTELLPEHQHCELIPFIMDCFQHSKLLFIQSDLHADPTKLAPIQVAVLRGDESCVDDALLFVHLPHYPFPRLPSRIIECTPNKLVIKGKMHWSCRARAEDFEMTFLPNLDDDIPTCWWTVSLTVNGKMQEKYYVLHEHNSSPEHILSRFEYKDKRMTNSDLVLYQPNDPNRPNLLWIFEGWHPHSKLYVLLTYSDSKQYHLIDQCALVRGQGNDFKASSSK